MKLQIEAGERASVQFTTRAFTSGGLSLYDERGHLLMSIHVEANEERIRVEVEPGALGDMHVASRNRITFKAPQG